MSVQFVAVNWNRQKRIYDATLIVGVLVTLGSFVGTTLTRFPSATAETGIIRGLGFTALLLLQLIILIGPLARLDPGFLPLLYNRRHLGVTMAILALGHAGFAVFQYHALGNIDPFLSVLISNPDLTSVRQFPFELLGLVGLLIVLLMAATSHDFWLSALTPPVWKRLHMLVYLAYAALVAHVGLGLLQSETSPIYPAIVGLGVVATVVVHWVASRSERPADRALAVEAGWVDVCAAADVPEGRAKIGVVAGERVAVFKHEGHLSCVSNVCKHQNGPLGEGRIVDGCITCPWHGYQYRPDTGASPPPFNDSVPTFELKVIHGRVLVNNRPNPPGTRVEPWRLEPSTSPSSDDGPAFYVGYQPRSAAALAHHSRLTVVTILVLAVGAAVAFALGQRDFAPSSFEYGTATSVDGVVRATPYPMIEVNRPGATNGQVSRYLLAATGKHGAQAVIEGLDGRRVRLSGALAFRGNLTLLEIADRPASADVQADPSGPGQPMGRFDLVGEVVDSKCYAGVMNPGQGKTHRGCAARCLSGGMAPLLVVHNPAGDPLELLLVTNQGKPLPGVDRLAGTAIAVAAEVTLLGDLWIAAVDPDRIRRADRGARDQ